MKIYPIGSAKIQIGAQTSEPTDRYTQWLNKTKEYDPVQELINRLLDEMPGINDEQLDGLLAVRLGNVCTKEGIDCVHKDGMYLLLPKYNRGLTDVKIFKDAESALRWIIREYGAYVE